MIFVFGKSIRLAITSIVILIVQGWKFMPTYYIHMLNKLNNVVPWVFSVWVYLGAYK